MSPNRHGPTWKTLDAALASRLGRPIRIRELTRLLVTTSASHHLEEFRLKLADGSQIQLFAKQVGPGGASKTAASVKPSSLLDPYRETLVHCGPLKSARLGTPLCYGVWEESTADRRWLLLEKVHGVELFQIGEMDAWKAACLWLARLHARFGGEPANFPVRLRLLRLDADYLRGRMAAAWNVVESSAMEPSRKAAFSKIRDRYDDWIELSLNIASTLTHGDFYPTNILVLREGGSLRICPVDWEMAGWGPGLADLAAVTAGDWTAEKRGRLSAAYREEAERLGVALPPDFDTVLNAWRLHVAVQWVGWSANWRPPPDQRRDWLSDALEIGAAEPG